MHVAVHQHNQHINSPPGKLSQRRGEVNTASREAKRCTRMKKSLKKMTAKGNVGLVDGALVPRKTKFISLADLATLS